MTVLAKQLAPTLHLLSFKGRTLYSVSILQKTTNDSASPEQHYLGLIPSTSRTFVFRFVLFFESKIGQTPPPFLKFQMSSAITGLGIHSFLLGLMKRVHTEHGGCWQACSLLGMAEQCWGGAGGQGGGRALSSLRSLGITHLVHLGGGGARSQAP